MEDNIQRTETYTTYCGAQFTTTPYAGEVDGITWSCTRSGPTPIYTMGSANPRSFGCRRRTLSGSILFTSTLDRSLFPDTIGNPVPSFNVKVNMCNEYGIVGHKTIYHIELFNEGAPAKEIIVNEAMPFIAFEVGPLIKNG